MARRHRVIGKKNTCKKEDLSGLASKVVEGVRGNALTVAKNVGNTELCIMTGVDKLVVAMRDGNINWH